MHGDDTDAARRAGAWQGYAIRLRGQHISRRQRMLGEKRVHRLCVPCGADAVGKIEGPGHLAAKAVDLQGDAANGSV